MKAHTQFRSPFVLGLMQGSRGCPGRS
ncbi:unnamed protein product [Chondrus crispus]|uniref:Uncharacterized protein n=1 Tax=Chondrus crispus TaxID=2769 RepID=R7QHC6_CHOCR|nr:unnamed protein product [Chondrus crispus]CDF37464.1 unnamed protein product [Chondrus crispus]|eukprot:XP_005717283.1 unnamed protein product [Chondrus crispus]